MLSGHEYLRLTNEIIAYNGTEKVRAFVPYDEAVLKLDVDRASSVDDDLDQNRLTDGEDIEERLIELARLLENNLISDSEYTAKREKILDEI